MDWNSGFDSVSAGHVEEELAESRPDFDEIGHPVAVQNKRCCTADGRDDAALSVLADLCTDRCSDRLAPQNAHSPLNSISCGQNESAIRH